MTEQQIMEYNLVHQQIAEFCDTAPAKFKEYADETINFLGDMVYYASNGMLAKDIWTEFHLSMATLFTYATQFKVGIDKLIEILGNTYFDD